LVQSYTLCADCDGRPVRDTSRQKCMGGIHLPHLPHSAAGGGKLSMWTCMCPWEVRVMFRQSDLSVAAVNELPPRLLKPECPGKPWATPMIGHAGCSADPSSWQEARVSCKATAHCKCWSCLAEELSSGSCSAATACPGHHYSVAAAHCKCWSCGLQRSCHRVVVGPADDCHSTRSCPNRKVWTDLLTELAAANHVQYTLLTDRELTDVPIAKWPLFDVVTQSILHSMAMASLPAIKLSQ
jgi:hypothetical protein